MTFKVFAQKPSSALELDGSDDFIVVPNSSAMDVGTNDFTLEAMVNFSVDQPNYAGIIAKGNS